MIIQISGFSSNANNRGRLYYACETKPASVDFILAKQGIESIQVVHG
jgi:hypothetical protein